ncbi:hypothetical protein SDC9_182690 [bioreactor metagenome]|uniref:Uncharacterized protein n=1 Tax=bioreactor metagenome TaxID=1076179 RepID=A0A645HHQ0_9ZZZZ
MVPIGLAAGSGERLQEQLPTRVGSEYVLALVAPVEHMIDGSRIFHSKFPGHVIFMTRQFGSVKSEGETCGMSRVGLLRRLDSKPCWRGDNSGAEQKKLPVGIMTLRSQLDGDTKTYSLAGDETNHDGMPWLVGAAATSLMQ